MITLDEYLMGRDKLYPDELTPQLLENARLTIAKVNSFLYIAKSKGVLTLTPILTSGWRPQGINSRVKGAAKRSLHLTCQAIDLNDKHGQIDDFAFNNQRVLVDLGLYLEHPDATPNWCHLQTKPPRSGNRVFRP